MAMTQCKHCEPVLDGALLGGLFASDIPPAPRDSLRKGVCTSAALLLLLQASVLFRVEVHLRSSALSFATCPSDLSLVLCQGWPSPPKGVETIRECLSHPHLTWGQSRGG